MDWLTATRSFCQVVEQGSFTAAAQALATSPSAVSKRIDWLEGRLGVTLFIRTTRRVSLTEEGQTYLQHARSLLKQFEAMVADTRASGREPLGTLRLAAPVSVGSVLLMPHIKAFMARHPGIRFQLDTLPPGTQPDLDHDLVICRKRDDFDSPYHRGLPLRDYHLQMWASPDYLASRPPIRGPEDLEAHRFIIASYQKRDGMVEMEEGFSIPLDNFGLVTDNVEALLQAGLSGMGIVFASEVFLRAYVEQGLLRPVLPQVRSVRRQIWAFYPKADFMPLKTKLFLEFLKERL
ncbi:LysR family transcriptional regulator [Gallaecimonas sp. GXIMD4217]|uniref:LysR family transcriptional regulator n=1 Tax=Gallaecimonas sp. GXIMD4217 TaxID=3131927 RepID=UPI00311AF319